MGFWVLWVGDWRHGGFLCWVGGKKDGAIISPGDIFAAALFFFYCPRIYNYIKNRYVNSLIYLRKGMGVELGKPRSELKQRS